MNAQFISPSFPYSGYINLKSNNSEILFGVYLDETGSSGSAVGTAVGSSTASSSSASFANTVASASGVAIATAISGASLSNSIGLIYSNSVVSASGGYIIASNNNQYLIPSFPFAGYLDQTSGISEIIYGAYVNETGAGPTYLVGLASGSSTVLATTVSSYAAIGLISGISFANAIGNTGIYASIGSISGIAAAAAVGTTSSNIIISGTSYVLPSFPFAGYLDQTSSNSEILFGAYVNETGSSSFVGSAVGAATVSAIGVYNISAVGSSTGSSTVYGICGTGGFSSVGHSNGQSTVIANGLAAFKSISVIQFIYPSFPYAGYVYQKTTNSEILNGIYIDETGQGPVPGLSSGISTVSGFVVSNASSVGVSNGVSTVSGFGFPTVLVYGTGSSSGSGTAIGSAFVAGLLLSNGFISASSASYANGTSNATSNGSILGINTTNGIIRTNSLSSSIVYGQGSAFAVGSSFQISNGISLSSSNVIAHTFAFGNAIGAISGQAFANAMSSNDNISFGISSGISFANAVVLTKKTANGSIIGVSGSNPASGFAKGNAFTTGTTISSSNAIGNTIAQIALVGTSSGTSTVSGIIITNSNKTLTGDIKIPGPVMSGTIEYNAFQISLSPFTYIPVQSGTLRVMGDNSIALISDHNISMTNAISFSISSLITRPIYIEDGPEQYFIVDINNNISNNILMFVKTSIVNF